MRFEVGGQEYELHFQHTHTKGQSPQFSVITVAKINRDAGPKKWETVATGHALCSTRDHFSKERGRKIALARALKVWDSTSGKVDILGRIYRDADSYINRTKVWAAYFGRKE